jgi:N4-gp56 family major capsid protein
MADQPVTSAFATAATEQDLILSIVQDELNRNSFLRPTIMDLSSQATKGVKQVEVPKFTASFAGPAAQNPDALTNTEFQSPTFGTDAIVLDKWVTLPYRVPDRSSTQSMISVEAELAKSAGNDMGNYIDDQIITELRLASAAGPDHLRDLDGAAIAGVASAITLEGISTARQLLNRANVKQQDRWLIIPPEQEKALIDLDQFRNADKYGSREALLRGEIGQIYGFRVMVHNGLSSNEAVAYHKECCAVAVQQEIKFESRRADLRVQSTDYSFALGMGAQVMNDGKMQVYMLGA